MGKLIIVSFIYFFTSGCTRYSMLEGKSRPVYIETHPATNNSYKFYFDDLQNLRGNFVNEVEINNAGKSILIIKQPSYIRLNGDEYLIYPGERLQVMGENADSIIRINGTSQRNRELKIFYDFRNLEVYHKIQLPENGSILEFQNLEKENIEKIALSEANSKRIFDSLINKNKVSKNFKKYTKGYLYLRYHGGLLMLYRHFKDSLTKHNLYLQKCKELLFKYNQITNSNQLNNRVRLYLNELIWELYPGIRLREENQFYETFDSLEKNLTPVIRDYILSQLMYRALVNKFNISPDYRNRYNSLIKNKSYKKIISNLSKQGRKTEKSATITEDLLMNVNGKHENTIQQVLSRFNGKIILVDVWATWCLPCRRDIPILDSLFENYPKDKIAFVNISIDKEIEVWQKFVLSSRNSNPNNFLLPQTASNFMNRYQISQVPRYLLFDTKGQLIETAEPLTHIGEVKEILERLIKQ